MGCRFCIAEKALEKFTESLYSSSMKNHEFHRSSFKSKSWRTPNTPEIKKIENYKFGLKLWSLTKGEQKSHHQIGKRREEEEEESYSLRYRVCYSALYNGASQSKTPAATSTASADQCMHLQPQSSLVSSPQQQPNIQFVQLIFNFNLTSFWIYHTFSRSIINFCLTKFTWRYYRLHTR